MNYLNDNLPFNAVACNLFTRKNKPFLQNGLTDKTRLNYINLALAKSRASRGKLKIQKANDSTPFNRAFFVRSVYAPIQYSLSSDSLFSMVAHNGKGFALCRFPCMTVFDPVMRYRQIVESFAVTSKNSYKETA
ncbi:TPA: ash family protein [Haemophilus influenzae]|uniref:ash family protein n=1 Tax=Haemophilus influenzae TaxID=727 RepID=UPI000D488FF5|nr:ash family protein [Haemophilus influenzae]PRJ16379.1 Ash protein family protein [Haemophilus influenzae]PRJ93155.1 Ash protein family protein [Haemophilus influenzae]PRK63109.1 Ash protein family protein [Haemophilus influenzae]PRM08049.1 Ash protein family protein [Haemophilus influenzae]PRM49484.1 Ash protein family protein [Haemophilus influenzae]